VSDNFQYRYRHRSNIYNNEETMMRKHGESTSLCSGGLSERHPMHTTNSPIQRKRKRRATSGSDSRTDDIVGFETRHFLQYPCRLSKVILCYCLILQALSFVTERIPKTSAFIPHSHRVSSEVIPAFTRTIAPLSAPTPTKTTKTCKRSNTRTTSSTATTTTLFGIKGFRSWFQDQFPNAVRNVDVVQHQDTFDHVLIDMNQILHVILRRSRNSENAMKLLMVELDTLTERCKPVHSLVLAIDGSPAAAKLATQRKRRFSILKNTKFKLKHSDKLRMSKRRRERRLRNYKSELQSLQLTPGTECMKSMESAILYWAWQRLQSQGKPHSRLLPRVRIYVSSSLVPGEGEIKLLEWINNYRGHLSRKPGQSIALIGGDADLLLEAMVIPPSWTHNVFVLRPEEAVNPNNSNKKSPGKSSSAKTSSKQTSNNRSNNNNVNNSNNNNRRFRKNLMHCTSLWEMTLSLDDYCRKNIPKEYYNPETNPEDQNLLLQIRTDMVLLFMLNGNDYLPRVVAVGFRGVLKSYLALLEEWIKRNGSIQNVGLVDPNTLNFRSDFCADFFSILGRNAPSERDRWKSVKKSAQKTYQSMLNDMSAIGFIPTPIRFRFVVGGNNDQKELQEVEMQGQEIESEDDLYVEDDDEDEDDDDEEEDDDDDDEVSLNGDAEIYQDVSKVQRMQVVLGKKSEGDYHEYSVRVNTTSKKAVKKAKGALSKMVLEDFDLLEFIDGSDDVSGKDYEWEIEIPAPANVGRYLAGLIWTLQTYQDGVCPTYHYNYGKCLAPTGREIASYFVKAMDENRGLGASELLGDFKPGGSVSAGVACLAALPISVKDLVPKPYSLIGDKDIEDFYSQCMNSTDNFFHLKKFETLVEAEVERFGVQTENISGKGKATKEQEVGNVSDLFSGRQINLGDHYWTVLKRTSEAVQHPFKPPPPPAENFSKLRANNRIKAGRIISMDLPSPRSSINYTMAGSFSSNSNYPRKFWDRNNIEIDHLNFGSFINGSESSILEMPYKIAFGSSPDMYGGSQQNKDKTSFKLLKSKTVNVPKYENGDHDNESNNKPPERILGSMTNPENQNGLIILKQLLDIHLVGGYTFSESLNGELVLSVSFDETNGNLPLKEMSFSHLKHSKDSATLAKQYLASLALDAILNESAGGEKITWYDLTFNGMKAFFDIRHSVVQKNGIIDVNLENQSALVVIKQLCDIGMVQSYEFNETPASADFPEKISLSLCMGSLKSEGILSTSSPPTVTPTRPETLLFEQCRTKESKKWTRQHLVSLALDAMIAERTSSEDDSDSMAIHWYNLSFKDVKYRIDPHGYF